jgi:hypothetical protein
MIWHDYASEGDGAPEDDVAPFLPIDDKSGFEFEVFSARFRRDGVARRYTVFDVKLSGCTNVAQYLNSSVASSSSCNPAEERPGN